MELAGKGWEQWRVLQLYNSQAAAEWVNEW